MKAKEIEPLLAEWLALFQRIEANFESLKRMFGAEPESEIVTLMYDAHQAYSKLLSKQIGDDDNWMDWYLWENGAGTNGMQAKSAYMEKMMCIKDLRGLAKLIERPTCPNDKVSDPAL